MKVIKDEEILKRKHLGIIFVVFILLLGGAIGGYSYRNSAANVLRQYVEKINGNRYIEAYQLFYNNEQLTNFSQEYVVKYMNDYFRDNELIKLERGRLINQSTIKPSRQELLTYEVTYYFKDRKVNALMGLIKQNDKWKVVFPFKTEELKVYAPIGAEIIVDNKKIEAKENEEYVVVNLFPGKYNVRIKYPEKVKEDYITSIHLPKESEVYSPYNAYTISVKAPLYATVELAGNKVENTEGVVKFPNVIEGTYEVKVYDKNGNLESYSEKINITPKETSFEVDEMILSQTGYEKISQFANKFYGDYIQGIRKKDTHFLEQYIQSEKKEIIMNEYREWFINKKNVVDAKLDIEVSKVKLINMKELEMQVLEVVSLENQEGDKNVNYQITLSWNNLIDISGSTYTIKDRYLVESLIAYKDEKGNWIQY